METRLYVFVTDPGHGWLRVPAADVAALGYTPTRCSPLRQGVWYLEEDCDAPRFLALTAAAGWSIETQDQYVPRFDR